MERPRREAKVLNSEVPRMCLTCFLGFDTKNAAMAHFSVVHGELYDSSDPADPSVGSDFKATSQSNDFTTPMLPDTIQRNQAKESPHKCYDPDCGRSFASTDQARDHIISFHRWNPRLIVSCQTCEQLYPSVTLLTLHKRTCCPSVSSFVRGKVYKAGPNSAPSFMTTSQSKPNDLDPAKQGMVGKRIQSKEYPHKCSIPNCAHHFSSTDQGREHIISFHRLNPRLIVSCQTCGQVYSSVKLLTLHKRTCRAPGPSSVHGKAYKVDPSSAPDLSLADPSMLVKRNQAHGSPHKCYDPDCGLQFSSPDQTRDHIISFHSWNPRLIVSCQTCGQMYPSVKLLNLHKSTCRPTTSPYECSLCGKKFEAEKGALAHAKPVHGPAGATQQKKIKRKAQKEKVQQQKIQQEELKLERIRQETIRKKIIRLEKIQRRKMQKLKFPHKCFCRLAFQTEVELNAHEEAKHSFPCRVEGCGDVFGSLQMFHTHNLAHDQSGD